MNTRGIHFQGMKGQTVKRSLIFSFLDSAFPSLETAVDNCYFSGFPEDLNSSIVCMIQV